jgi:hypothetical protein
MSSFSRIPVCGALAGLTVLIGVAAGPANAHLTSNSLLSNALGHNALAGNTLLYNRASPNSGAALASTPLDELNGVVVEAVSLPLDAER